MKLTFSSASAAAAVVVILLVSVAPLSTCYGFVQQQQQQQRSAAASAAASSTPTTTTTHATTAAAITTGLLFVRSYTRNSNSPFLMASKRSMEDDNNSTIIMTPIDTDLFQNAYDIYIDPPGTAIEGSVPTTTMFTIFPSDDDGSGVTVETSPPFLCTIISLYDDGGDLSLEWNTTTVSSTAMTSGGAIRIGIPSDQLKGVGVKGGHNNVQIKDGFTNINYLFVNATSTNSMIPILRASMTSSNISTELKLFNSGGQMYVDTNIPVTNGTVTDGGKSWVETPSMNYMNVDGDGSELTIQGNVNVSSSIYGHVHNGAQLTVTGTITGNIDNSHDSTVNALSCDNVTSSDSSICNAAGPQK